MSRTTIAPQELAPALSRWLALALALAVALAGLGLRLYDLGGPALWADEANTVGRALAPLSDLPGTLAARDTHPPFYYLLLHPWLAGFGDSETALRGFSVLWGMASLPLVALAGRALAGRWGAVAGLALAASAPVLVIFAQEGRGYTLLGFLGLASFLSLRRALASGRRLDWALYVTVILASVYTHNLAFLWLTWQVAVALVDGPRARWRQRIGRLAIGQAIAYALYLPWALALAGQLTAFASGGAWLGPPSPARLLFTVGSFLGGASSYREGDLRPIVGLTAPYLYAGPMLLAYAGARGLPSRDRWSLLALAVLPPATLFAVGQVLPVYVDRAALVAVFGVLLLQAAAFRPGQSSAARVVLATSLLLTLALQLASLRASYAQPRDGYRELAADVARAARPGERVLFLPGFGQVAFTHYWQRQPGPATLIDLDASPRPTEAELRELTHGFRALWIVRVAAPPPEAAVDLPGRLEAAGLRRVGVRDYPDPLLRLELYAADASDMHGLPWSPLQPPAPASQHSALSTRPPSA